jgi:hypothetical protein
MATQDVGRPANAPAERDLRGVLAAFATALGMWFFIIMGALGLILKILH